MSCSKTATKSKPKYQEYQKYILEMAFLMFNATGQELINELLHVIDIFSDKKEETFLFILENAKLFVI